MARSHYISIRPRDRARLNEVLEDGEADITKAFDRIAGRNQTQREELRQACLAFLSSLANFATSRTLARAELIRDRGRIDAMNALERALIGPAVVAPRGATDLGFREFMALKQAVALAERRWISDRALAAMSGFLARQKTPLNAALTHLIAVANDDAAVAHLANALTNHKATVTQAQVRDLRRRKRASPRVGRTVRPRGKAPQ